MKQYTWLLQDAVPIFNSRSAELCIYPNLQNFLYLGNTCLTERGPECKGQVLLRPSLMELDLWVGTEYISVVLMV